MMEAWEPTYNDLKQMHTENFSLGNINTDIQSKFALIALTCHLTMKAKQQKPDVNHYKILMQLTKNNPLPEKFIKSLAIICEDFAYGCTEFPTFNIKTPVEMAQTVSNILSKWLPF